MKNRELSSTNSWAERVRNGLIHYHDAMQLGQLDWGNRFVWGCVDNEWLEDVMQRGYAVQAALRWGLEQLKQSGITYQVQSYETLWLRYVERLTVSECARALDRDENTVKQRQRKGWERLGNVLAAEWENRLAVDPRRALMMQLQYEVCTPDERQLLGFLAVFRGVVNVRVALIVDAVQFQPHLARLLERKLVSQNEQMEIVMSPSIRAVVRHNLKAVDVVLFNRLAADFYTQQGNEIETIYHWQQAGEQERAIERLLARYRQLDNGAMLAILDGFERERVSSNSWAKLKLLSGRLSQTSQNLEDARTEYEAALTAEDVLVQAEAYYRLGRLYRQLNVDQSFTYFTLCQQIVADNTTQPALRLSIQSLLQETWVFIDQQKDLVKAKKRLEQISELLQNYMGDDTMALEADVANGWASYYALQQNSAESVVHRRRAWMLARQTQDINRAMRFGNNLASDYLNSGKFDDAERMFLECQSLAQVEKNEWVVAACHKGLGACYLRSDVGKAIQHYESAYRYFDAADNHHWRSTTCYDLAEAHLLNGTLDNAQRYFDEGLQLAIAANNEFVHNAFEQLQHDYLELSSLHLTLRQIINYTRISGKISKKRCVDQLGIKPRTVNRRLNELIERGIIQKQGKGRNVHYVLMN